MRVSVAIGLLALTALPAQAQDEKHPPECYVVVSPVQGVSPLNFLMINKCTGASWMLVQYSVPKEGPPNQKGERELLGYTWHWVPIQPVPENTPLIIYPQATR